jgi:inorganic triphosphatase YgiF
MLTLDHDISKSLGNPDMANAHSLYHHALSVASLASLFSPATLRAVSDKLAEEAQRAEEQHEREVLAAMAFFLTMEAAAR